MPAYSREQVLALAQDPASAKAGQGLAVPAKWSGTGHSDAACWGECQGSGKNPYRTQVAFDDGASKCSCPSRKFPCKHAIGLLLMHADGGTAAGTAPDWVTEWLTGRSARVTARAERAAAPPDPEAAAKRSAARGKRVDAGVEELRRWLDDLARNGLAHAQTQPWAWWDGAAKRMVDAQAKGLSSRIRAAAATAASGGQRPDWPARLLDQVGSLHLMARAWASRDRLPAETAAALATRIGATTATEDVLARGERLTDAWVVVGSSVTDDGQLRTLQQWLRGTRTGRTVTFLSFAAGKAPLDAGLAPGMVTEAELALYPGTRPSRALIVTRLSEPRAAAALTGASTWEEALHDVADVLAVDPWCEVVPLAIEAVMVLPDPWRLRDGEGRSLPLAGDGWSLLALSEGHPIDVVAEWDGFALRATAAARAGRSLSVVS